jgi:Legionella pneumophila major outer membrane protein precursor
MSLRTLLLTSVSAISLAAASLEARAADLQRPALITKAPAFYVESPWSFWAEGGAFWTGGSDVNFGDPISVGRVKPGWEGAVGFDYRFQNTPWHVSAQVRYGIAKQSGNFTRNGAFAVPVTDCRPSTCALRTANVPGNGSFDHKEQHWLADFAVGRDVGLGFGQTQLKAGLRIADISARTTGSANFVAPTAYSTGFARFVGLKPGLFSFQQDSRFVGGGPRVGLEGTMPLGGAWAFDWLGGVAVLFGSRSLNVNTTGSASTFGINALGASDDAVVFNLDAQVGLSYWVTPNVKLTGSYRFDGYWGALKTIDANGLVANQDRFFFGPMLRLTVKN